MLSFHRTRAGDCRVQAKGECALLVDGRASPESVGVSHWGQELAFGREVEAVVRGVAEKPSPSGDGGSLNRGLGSSVSAGYAPACSRPAPFIGEGSPRPQMPGLVTVTRDPQPRRTSRPRAHGRVNGQQRNPASLPSGHSRNEAPKNNTPPREQSCIECREIVLSASRHPGHRLVRFQSLHPPRCRST